MVTGKYPKGLTYVLADAKILPLTQWISSTVHCLESRACLALFVQFPLVDMKKKIIHQYNCRKGKAGADRTYYHPVEVIASASFC